MATITKPINQYRVGTEKNGWRHLVKFFHGLAAINKQCANLTKLRNHIRLEHLCIREIGVTQFDLIWAYSSQFTNDHSENNHHNI